MSKRNGVWLSFNNQEEGFELPVLPLTSFSESIGGDGSSMDVIGLGKINVIKSRDLMEYEIKSFFPSPSNNYPFINSSVIFEPPIYVEYIKKWIDTQRPIRFIYVSESMEVNLPVSIEDFEYNERHGIIGDLDYKLKLKEYKFYSAKKIIPIVENGEVKAVSSVTKKRDDERVIPKTYTLKSGDTLWKVAKLQLGDGNRWNELKKLNNIKDSDLKRLKVGMVIKLP